MKKYYVVFCLFIILISSQALGLTINFSDDPNTEIYWPTWNNGTSDDTRDTIGIPNFIGGSVTLTETGYLTGIVIQYTADNYLNLWGVLKPSDLFIDVGADGNWNYLIKSFEIMGQGSVDTYAFNYSSTKGVNDSHYQLSFPPFSGTWNIRDNHPISGIGGSDTGKDVWFSGWETPSSVGNIVSSNFDFTNQGNLPGLYIGDEDLIISWTVICANDVVYERIPNNPVPEPATMVLLGSGLLGIWIFKRKRQ